MVATKYKLTYFNGTANGEAPRLIMKFGGIEFEDIRIPLSEWPEFKKGTLFGQVPTLEFDGHVMCQTKAICRYLAKQIGIGGKTAVDEALVDMVVYCSEDAWNKITDLFHARFLEPDNTEKIDNMKKVGDEFMVGWLERMEKMLKLNKGGDGYFVGDSITWADIYFFNVFDFNETLAKATVDWTKAPKLKALYDRVAHQPAIAEWVKTRPEGDFSI